MKIKSLKLKWIKALPLCLAMLAGFQISCKDSVDTSDIYTFTGQTIMDYVNENDSLTLFKKILEKSKVSDRSKSYLVTLLTARGNYTVFAPTNDAVTLYLDSIYDSKEWDIDTMSETIADRIAQNAIIDRGTSDALLTSDFPGENAAIPYTTLNDRHIQVSYGLDSTTMKYQVTLNKKSNIINPDIELTNGILHVVDHVISPSNESLSSLIDNATNLKIFSLLLKKTTWADSMLLYRDETYELYTDAEKRNLRQFNSASYVTPPHRYYGYMAFTETDSIFNAEWGIPMPVVSGMNLANEADIMKAIEEKCKEVYPNATSEDLTSADNAVNQFVSYHLVPFKEPYNLLIRHGDELGYNTDFPEQYTMCLYTYFHAMGKPNRLFKMIQLLDGKYYINRKSYFNNTFPSNGSFTKGVNMAETSVVDPGIQVFGTNGTNENNALNGYYYPISKIMTYTNFTRDVVLNDRIRYNLAQYFNEMMSNDMRTGMYKGSHYYIPHFPYRYCEHLRNEGADTDYRTPINAGTSGWAGMESDQFAFSNYFDVTFQLMPVPFAGTWEVRYTVSNISSRGLGQGYFGTNPDNLLAVGLPFDFRILGSNPKIGSVSDFTFDFDSTLCQENDRLMRNHMYMKNYMTYCINRFGQAHVMKDALREHINTMRLIVYRGYMEPDKTYYFRFKTMLDNETAYLFGDSFELCPKNIYDNPSRPEDVW